MGYTRLEAEGLIVGTQEWKRKQTEKFTERLRLLLNYDTGCNSTFTYAGIKTKEEKRKV